MKKVMFIKIISICLAILMLTLFCGCRKNNVGDSSLSSGYVSVPDNIDEQYYSLVREDGSVVILDENNNVVEGAVLNDDGSVTITNQESGETKTVSAEKIKEFDVTIGETTENNTPTVSEKENKEPNNNNSSASDKKNNVSVVTPSVSNNIPTGNLTETAPSAPNPPAEENPAELTPLTDAEIKQVEDYFFQLVNEERARVGVQPLTRNATLDKAAKIRVDELLKEYSHTRPNGTNYFTVLTELKYGTPHEDIWSDDGVNWNTTTSYDYGASAENLAGDYNTSKRALSELSKSFFDNFRYSPGHYQNMINPNLKYSGISVNSYIDNNVFKCDIIHIFTEK